MKRSNPGYRDVRPGAHLASRGEVPLDRCSSGTFLFLNGWAGRLRFAVQPFLFPSVCRTG